MRRWVSRFGIAFVVLAAAALAWSLVYAIVVGWRFDPRLPSEGTARWALLQSLNADYSWGTLTRSLDHFHRRLVFPATRAETILRGAIAAGLVLGAGAALAIAAIALRPRKPYGEARFGSILDAEKRRLTSRKGLVLGKLAGATLTSNEPGHVLLVGPTRSGKGQSFIVPNGVMWDGSAVFFDPKKENYAILGAYRAAAGDKVFLFNPGETRSHRYNPLDFIRRDDTMPIDALVVASFIVPDTPGEIWGKSARLLLAAMIGYVLTSPTCKGARHPRSVAKMLVSGKDIAETLNAILRVEKASLPSWVADAFRQYIALEPETRNSAVFNLNIAMNPWNNRLVAAATEASDFDIRDLRRKRMSIFIGCSVAQLDAFRPLLNILIQQIHDLLMAAPPGRDEPHQVLLMIDEFRQLGRMDDLVSKLSINAGYGFRVVLALQNLAQLDEVYGKAVRETTVSACATQLYIRIDDLETSNTLSKLLGETTIEIKRASFRSGADIFRHKTISIDYDAVPLRTPQQLRQMDARKLILLVSSARPFELDRVIYHADSPYRQALEKVQFKSVEVPELTPYADPAPADHGPAAPDAPRRGHSPGPRGAPGPGEISKRETFERETWERKTSGHDNWERRPHPPDAPASEQSGEAASGGETEAVPNQDAPRPSSAALDAKHDAAGPADPAAIRTVAAQGALALSITPETTIATTARTIPIEAVAVAQIDAAGAALRTVMAVIPESADGPEIAQELRQLDQITRKFGDDAAPEGDVEPKA